MTVGKVRLQGLLRFGVCICCAAMTACAGGGRLPQGALDMNADVAETEKRFMLLNILRAAGSEPLYFASLSNIDSRSRGNVSLGGEFEGGFELGDTLFDTGILLNDSTPRYSLTGLNNANFMRAMSRPVELGVIDRLLQRPYDCEFVFSLIVSKIGWAGAPVTGEPHTTGTSMADKPTTGKSEYRRRMRLLCALGLGVEPLLGDNTLFEDLGRDDVLELIAEVGVTSANFSIIPDRQSGDFDVIGQPGGFRFCFEGPPVLDVAGLSEKDAARVIDLTCRGWIVSQLGAAGLGGSDLARLSRADKQTLLESVSSGIRQARSRLETVDEAERPGNDGTSLAALVEGLRSQSESGSRDGVDEQELGRLENFGELAISIRSPIEIIDYLGSLSAEILRGGNATPVRTMPDHAYTEEGRDCWAEDTDARCSSKVIFAPRPGDGETAVSYHGDLWHIVRPLSDVLDQSSQALAVMSYMQSLAVDADDLSDAPRITVTP